MKFTASQQRALDLSRHLGITANAGSGKTRVLVERYVNILEQNPDISPRNVVAITFTEASAGELRTRIVREIDDRMQNTSSAQTRARLASVRSDIKSGYIGTIHSFATRLLKAYPVEAKVDASFGIVSGADQSLMQEDAISTVFFSVLQAAYDKGEDQELLEVFRVFGRKELTEIMASFFQNRTRVATVTNLLNRDEDDVVRHWEMAISAIADNAIAHDTINKLQSILALSKDGKTKNEALLALEAFRLAEGLHQRLRTYAVAYSKVFIDKGSIRAYLIKDAETLASLAPLVEELSNGNSLVSKIADFIGETESDFTESHRLLYRHLKQIVLLWDRVLQEYSERKTSIGLLDFDDLIEKGEQLLSIPLVASELTARFRYIMIDEYQDTDESQYRIARSLTEGFSDRNKLAVVGDPKQSIYCFRNADASVFNMTLKEISGEQASARSGDGIVSLQESFRMLAKPLAFINKVFASVMEPSSASIATEEVLYEPLVLGRTSASQGGVEFLLCDEELSSTNDEDDADEGGEFTLVARKIKSILSSQDYLVDDKGTLREATAKDIAVILRSRTPLNELEAALRAEDIPYVVRKGAGFFAQQEITDVISYLKFLLSPADDVSLVAILRSPFFSLSDTLLFQIAVNTRREVDAAMKERPLTLWERLQRYVEKVDEAPKHLLRAIELIKANLLLVGRVQIARLVEKILTESAVFATYSAGPHGSQKIANLRKFIDIARQADTSGFSTLFDLVERLQYLMDGADSEAQADVTTDEDAVQIMTAHGAKGLEFPIVIAAALHRQFNYDRVRVLDKELGLLLNYPDTDKKSKRPAICELIRLRSDHNTVAEEKRILYVALTRAKDHLIVSGTLRKGARKDNCLRWILNAISPEGMRDRPNTLKLLETIEVYDGETGKTSAEEMTFNIPVSYRTTDIAVTDVAPTEEKPFELGKLMLDPVEVRYRPERFSATQLLTFHQCPTKYYLAYGLGIPEEPKLAYDEQPDELSEKVRGALAGQIIHAMLEQVNGLVENGSLDVKRFDERFENVCVSLGITRDEESAPLRERASKDVSNFISHEFGTFVLSCDTFFTELPIQSQLDHQNSLYGIIDRLFKEPDGTWHLLDYKTDTKRRKGKQDQYDFQLAYYASLVKRLHPDATQIRSTVFYTHSGHLEQKTYDLENFDEAESSYLRIIDGIRTNESIPELKLLDRTLTHCEDCNYYAPSKKQCVVPLDQNPTDTPARYPT
ncbi:MAG TPA: UvrD-helicase domain-containing protein [Candidatus Kapabacteria bacterium]|nr:UvrD-helicase domain-containing protein [Candidatus Kapabacteria bacterium]